jgi:DNA-directed RNA polymerase specialized sigma24 family protein
MFGERCTKVRVGDDTVEAEAAFRETLLRLKAEGASNEEISAAVMRSPFILGLVWIVTSRSYFARRRSPASERGSSESGQAGRMFGRAPRLPENWGEKLTQDPELRDEWRCETIYLLGRACLRNGILNCDLERPNVGGYWRVIIMYKAAKAAWKLWKESRLMVRHGRRLRDDVSVDCCDMHEKDRADEENVMDRGSRRQSRGSGRFADKRQRENVIDLRLDLAMAIDELENPRQRKAMRLSLMGYGYPEIAHMEGMSYEMVRYAVEKGRVAIQMRLRRAA